MGYSTPANAKRDEAGGEIKARRTKAAVCSSRSPAACKQRIRETRLGVHAIGDNNYQANFITNLDIVLAHPLRVSAGIDVVPISTSSFVANDERLMAKIARAFTLSLSLFPLLSRLRTPRSSAQYAFTMYECPFILG